MTKFVARWTGSQWEAVGSGLNEHVFALAVFRGELFAGGNFRISETAPESAVVRWNGTDWTDTGLRTQTVIALAAGEDILYAGGHGGLAAWDGQTRSAPGGGIGGTVRALAIRGTNLYVGGEFTMAGGVAASRIAQWDGARWSSLGAGMGGGLPTVYSLAATETDLYAGGTFDRAGGIPANAIALWNGTEWSALGEGVTITTLTSLPVVHAILPRGHDVLVVGGFLAAGGNRQIHNFARWENSAWSSIGRPIVIVNGRFTLTLSDVAGATYGIEASNDMVQWTRVATFLSAERVKQFVDEASVAEPQRFYRAVSP